MALVLGMADCPRQLQHPRQLRSDHENLLDHTHVALLDPDTVGTAPYARSKLDVKTNGDVVTIQRVLRNSPPPGVYGVPMGLTSRNVDRYSDSHFLSPSLHVAFARIMNLETRSVGSR
jgi:vanillate O-demethylase monooxygenase subunit